MEEYSKEWKNLVNAANLYQQCLSFFFSIKENVKIIDLKNALKDENCVYYALKAIENMSDSIRINLLDELLYVVIYGNVSNSYLAKQIILGLDRTLMRNHITTLINRNASQNKDDIYIIKDLAIFLYELKYKTELLKFVDIYSDALRKSEFIDSQESMNELKQMDDWE